MTPRYRIAVALDDSDYAEIVLEHALDQAARHDSTDLHFVTVVANREQVDEAKGKLARLVFEGLELETKTEWHSRLHVRIGDPAEEIAQLAAELDVDLLVLGRFGVHGHGSTADRIIDNVACPTLVIRLGGHVVEASPQCARCVTVREESDGERWFCEDHSSPDALDLTTRMPSSSTAVGGGPLW